MNYASSHGGWYPRGEVTPEASLSLLYQHDREIDHALSGKTIPPKLVKEILARGECLSPETCGWHYVEGLHADDDHAIALFWDKAGLGHNGERFTTPGHFVHFIGGDTRFVRSTDWAGFEAKQNTLLAQRPNRR